MKYHSIPSKMAKMRKTDTTYQQSKDVGQLELSYVAGGNAKHYSHFGNQLGSFL